MLEPAHGLAHSRPYVEPAPRPWRGLFASLFAREAQCSPGAPVPRFVQSLSHPACAFDASQEVCLLSSFEPHL